jgi:hypothetical protein
MIRPFACVRLARTQTAKAGVTERRVVDICGFVISIIGYFNYQQFFPWGIIRLSPLFLLGKIDLSPLSDGLFFVPTCTPAISTTARPISAHRPSEARHLAAASADRVKVERKQLDIRPVRPKLGPFP